MPPPTWMRLAPKFRPERRRITETKLRCANFPVELQSSLLPRPFFVAQAEKEVQEFRPVNKPQEGSRERR